MHPDPGRDILEQLHAGLSPDARARLGQELRVRGFATVWDQVDRAPSMGPVDQGLFILDRLYPEMPAEHRQALRRQMEEAYHRGEWHGFQRVPR